MKSFAAAIAAVLGFGGLLAAFGAIGTFMEYGWGFETYSWGMTAIACGGWLLYIAEKWFSSRT